MEYAVGSVLLLFSVFLMIAILMQSGKSKKLSGAIAGGAETFFGKTKGKAIDKVLSKATTAVAIIFIVLVIAVYVIQDKPNRTMMDDIFDNALNSSEVSE